jgi:hypothetical protein
MLWETFSMVLGDIYHIDVGLNMYWWSINVSSEPVSMSWEPVNMSWDHIDMSRVYIEPLGMSRSIFYHV